MLSLLEVKKKKVGTAKIKKVSRARAPPPLMSMRPIDGVRPVVMWFWREIISRCSPSKLRKRRYARVRGW